MVCNLDSQKVLKEFESPVKTNKVYMDDFCAYIACLDENERSVHFSMMNWEIKTTEIKRPELSDMFFQRKEEEIR